MLATDGRQALSTRRLAAEVGTSTMAVYTHFGSMDRLHHEVRRDGFARLCAEIDALPQTKDPVADLAALTLTYVDTGAGDPQLYRAMFTDRSPAEDDEGKGVFERFLTAVRRCIEVDRFDAAEGTLTRAWAAQIWVAAHGMITLAHAEMLPESANRFLVTDMICRLAVGYGDRPVAAQASVQQGGWQNRRAPRQPSND